MFVINNPKGTHLGLFSKNFSKKYSSSVVYDKSSYGKEKLN
jgi:hypothetical protein